MSLKISRVASAGMKSKNRLVSPAGRRAISFATAAVSNLHVKIALTWIIMLIATSSSITSQSISLISALMNRINPKEMENL
jgi:hypothetical protein